MTPSNITMYTDQELSLRVFNEHDLYVQRHDSDFLNNLEFIFVYTPEQYEVLLQDLKDDLEEIKMVDAVIQTEESIRELVNKVKCRNFEFIVSIRNGDPSLQIQFDAPCNVDGGEPVRQYCRHWVLQYTMCDSEVIRTCYKAAQAAALHEFDEHFTYMNEMIYSPHINVNALVGLRRSGDVTDKRIQEDRRKAS